MARLRLLIITVVCTALAALVGSFAGQWMSPSPKLAQPPLIPDRIVPLECGNVGDVWESEMSVVRVPIRNTTTRPIRIENLSASCQITRIEPTSCTVPAGGEVAIAVTLDLTGRQWVDMGLLSRPFQFLLTAVVEGVQRPIRLAVTGTGRSRIAVSPLYLNFGESIVAGHEPVSRAVTVSLHDPADTVRASSSSDLIRVAVRSGPKGGSQLVVTPDSARLSGDFAGTIRVEAIGPDGRVTGVATVTVEGTVRKHETTRASDGENRP